MLTKFALILSLSLTSVSLFAAVLGDFSKSKNLPGYIDLDPKSDVYKGVVKAKIIDDGINRLTPSAMLAKLFNGETIDTSKLELYITSLKKYQKNAFTSYCMEKLPKNVTDHDFCKNPSKDEKLSKKFKQEKSYLVTEVAMKKFLEAIALSNTFTKSEINSEKAQPFLNVFFSGIELYEAIHAIDQQRGKADGLLKVIGAVYKMALDNVVHFGENKVEAVNLLVPDSLKSEFPNKIFFAPSDLAELKKRNIDTSNFNPNDSGFWRKPEVPISKFNLSNYNNQHASGVHDNQSIEFIKNLDHPEVVIDAVYKPGRITGGASAKFNVLIEGQKWKIKYVVNKADGLKTMDVFKTAENIIAGSEVNVEPVVNNIAAALGFTVDPTYYKEKVRLYFSDDVYAKNGFDEAYIDMMKEMKTAFPSLNIEPSFKNIVTDGQGRKYVELRSISLEKKSDNDADVNIGFFVRHGMGKDLKREFRAFNIFLAWINDPDAKNENNKVKVIPTIEPNGEVDYKVIHSNSDMGAALFAGMPNTYGSHFVKEVKKDKHGNPKKIDLKYPRLYNIDGFTDTSIDDARWMLKLMVQLTRDQLEHCFYKNGHPLLVSKYFTDLMLRKRNQLIDALNMEGETFTNFWGEEITIKKVIEYTDGIPGYEAFFQKGQLVDPENKLFDPNKEYFPRNWSASMSTSIDDKPHDELWSHIKAFSVITASSLAYNAINPGLGMTTNNPTMPIFQELSASDGVLKNACSGNCFFQGFYAGVDSFLPWRFVIANPNKDPAFPYWIVDMFRFGVRLGENGMIAEQLLGLPSLGKFSPTTRLRIGSGLFRTYEFIKIHPVKNMAGIYEKLGSVFTTPALSFNRAAKDFVSNMSEGESLVLSTYTGLESEAKFVYDPLNFLQLIGPGVGLGGDKILTSRVSLYKDENKKFVANWSKLSLGGVSLTGYFSLILARMPLFQFQVQELEQIDRIYIFDSTKDEEFDILRENMFITSPKNVPAQFNVENRILDIGQSRSLLSTLGWTSKSKIRRDIDLKYENKVNNFTKNELSYESEEISGSMFKIFLRDYLLRSSVNDQGDFYFKVKMHLEKMSTEKPDFIKMYDEVKYMLPKDMFPYDMDQVSYYLGRTSFDIDTIYSHEGLNDIFSDKVSDMEFCSLFVSLNKIKEGMTECRKWTLRNMKKMAKAESSLMANEATKSDVISFMESYKRVKELYSKVKNVEGKTIFGDKKKKKEVKKFLKELTLFMKGHIEKWNVLEIFERLVKRDNYYRSAKIDAYIPAFPGEVDIVESSPLSTGKFKPEIRHLTQKFTDIYEVMTDKLTKAVSGFFYLSTRAARTIGL